MDDVTRRAGPADGPDYEILHATVVDAIRYVTAGQPIEAAAHEALQRLRDVGMQIPSRPPDDPFPDVDPANDE